MSLNSADIHQQLRNARPRVVIGSKPSAQRIVMKFVKKYGPPLVAGAVLGGALTAARASELPSTSHQTQPPAHVVVQEKADKPSMFERVLTGTQRTLNKVEEKTETVLQNHRQRRAERAEARRQDETTVTAGTSAEAEPAARGGLFRMQRTDDSGKSRRTVGLNTDRLRGLFGRGPKNEASVEASPATIEAGTQDTSAAPRPPRMR